MPQQLQHHSRPVFPYPFENLVFQQREQHNESREPVESQSRPSNSSSSIFGAPSTNFGVTGMPKSIGNVFGQEWRDLLKFIAVTKGNTDVPTGLEPMNFRPANLPPASLEEQKKVAKLVEQNRKEYIAKQMKKKQEQDKKLAEQKQKEDKLSKVWHNEVLANWDQMKTTARVRELWTEGIPAKVRNEVWYRAIGNKSIVTVDLFNIMAERGRKLADLLRKHQVIENQIIENKGVPSKVNEKITSLKQCQAGGDQQS